MTIYIYIILTYLISALFYLFVLVKKKGCKAFLVSSTKLNQCKGKVEQGKYFCHKHSKWIWPRIISFLVFVPTMIVLFTDVNSIDEKHITLEKAFQILLNEKKRDWQSEMEKETGLSYAQIIKNAKIAKEESFDHVTRGNSNAILGDFNAAFIEFNAGANKGNPTAKSNLGSLYIMGWGCEIDSLQGFKLIKEAAVEGEPVAQHNIGVMYENGYKGKDSILLAADWYKKSALNNYRDGQKKLASLYKEGIGIEANLDSAIYWYKEASKLGDIESEFMLGSIYLYEFQNYKQSFYWYNRGASKGDSPSKADLAIHYIEGLGVRKDYNKAELLLREAISSKVPNAMYNLGRMYQDDQYQRMSSDSTEKYYKLAANLEQTEAQRDYGSLLLELGGIDSITGIKYLEKAAEKNDVVSQVMLFYAYNSNAEKQNYWMHRAAETGDQLTQIQLSYKYASENNYKKADYWKDRAMVNDLSNSFTSATIPKSWVE